MLVYLNYCKYLLYVTLITISGLILILYAISLAIDITELKRKVLYEVESRIELRIEYHDADLEIFPVPGLKFSYLKIYDDEDILLEVNHLSIYLSIKKLLQGDIEIIACDISDGTVFLERSISGNFESLEPLLYLGVDNDSIVTPSTVFSKIPNRTELNNIQINIKDSYFKKTYNLYLWKSSLKVSDSEKSFQLDLYGKLNDKKIEIYKNIHFELNEFSYESLRFKGTIILDTFHLSVIDDVLTIFPHANFYKATATGRLYLYKVDEDLSTIELKALNLKNFSSRNNFSFGDVYISSKISYSLVQHRLGFDDIEAEWKDQIKTRGQGYLTFTDKPIIQFTANADYLNINSLEKIIGLWMDADIGKSIFFRGLPDTGYSWKYLLKLDIDSNNLTYNKLFFPKIHTKFSYKYPYINVEKLSINMYEGVVRNSGRIDISQKIPRIQLKGEVDGLLLELLNEELTNVKYITGKLYGNFNLETFGKTEDEILTNIKCNGNIIFKDGNLIGYLNLLRPVASVGKIINLAGPPGDSMAYETIEGGYSYHLGLIKIWDLNMKGVGLDATGRGKIKLDGEMDIRLTLALSGVVGKAIKLPIVFKGMFGRNLPYVDPIWIGTVYAGTIFLAGPAGATVGGIAGSAASDYVNRLFSTFRNFFTKEEE